MSTLEPDHDLEEVLAALAKGEKVRPELRAKLDKQAEQIREEVHRKHGTLNISERPRPEG